jgi:peptidoglycan hydrolase-like protein with peptidoglycan-binding domain
MPSPLNDAVLDREYGQGDRGRKVRLIQECLAFNGTAVKVDGSFGPATEFAVRVFQKKKGLAENGRVNQATMDLLIEPIRRAVRPISATGLSLGQLALAYANQHLAEHPIEVGGPNRGAWVRLYMNGMEGEDCKWCAGFVSHILASAAKTAGQPMPIKPTFSCDELALDAKKKGLLFSEKQVLDGTEPLTPGSIFLIRRTATDWVHTGIVLQSQGNVYQTIEGNTTDSGSPDGFEVCSRTRALKNVNFVRV